MYGHVQFFTVRQCNYIFTSLPKLSDGVPSNGEEMRDTPSLYHKAAESCKVHHAQLLFSSIPCYAVSSKSHFTILEVGARCKNRSSVQLHRAGRISTWRANSCFDEYFYGKSVGITRVMLERRDCGRRRQGVAQQPVLDKAAMIIIAL